METIFYILFGLVYFSGGFYLIKLLRRHLMIKGKYIRMGVFSFLYTLLFGIGIVTSESGGTVGFAFPFPVVWTALIYIWKWSDWTLFINGVILPFLFWWTLIFLIMMIKQYSALKDKNKARSAFE